MDAAPLDSLAGAVRSSGLLAEGSSGVALCSGGADSAALLAGLAIACGPERLHALHLNYGLREDSDRDGEACRELCDLLAVKLSVERPQVAERGNVQAAARALRYAAAERLRAERGSDWIATGHTRTDLAETVLYRLASSPGRRALLGLAPRRGRVIRPLLELGRDEVRALATAAGLPFRDDPTNEAPVYARNRIRNEVLPVLEEIAPAVEATIAATQSELRAESELLDRLAVESADAAAGAVAAAPGETAAIAADALAALEPALRRLVLRELAERAAGRPVALGHEPAAEISRLSRAPEGGVVELRGGIEARVEHGVVRFAAAAPEVPDEAALGVPGACRFGAWRVRAELRSPPSDPLGLDVAVLDPRALGPVLTVRPWRHGDRIRPLGLGGSKALQDLFTDRKVPRSLRRTLPVVTSGNRVAWVAGVAVSEEFAASPGSDRAAVLSASRHP